MKMKIFKTTVFRAAIPHIFNLTLTGNQLGKSDSPYLIGHLC